MQNDKHPRSLSEQKQSLILLVAAAALALPAHPHVSGPVLDWIDGMFVGPEPAQPMQPESAQPEPAAPARIPDQDVSAPPRAVEPGEAPRRDEAPKRDDVELRERTPPPAPRVDPGRPAAPPQGRYVQNDWPKPSASELRGRAGRAEMSQRDRSAGDAAENWSTIEHSSRARALHCARA